MFDALLRMQLGPIVERLAEMEAQLEDLYRRAESFCRIGICQQVDAASNTCIVSHGDLLTPAIGFFNPSAGAQTETRIPSVGEQCLLLNYGGGEGAAQSVALFGLNSSLFPPVSQRCIVGPGAATRTGRKVTMTTPATHSTGPTGPPCSAVPANRSRRRSALPRCR